MILQWAQRKRALNARGFCIVNLSCFMIQLVLKPHRESLQSLFGRRGRARWRRDFRHSDRKIALCFAIFERNGRTFGVCAHIGRDVACRCGRARNSNLEDLATKDTRSNTKQHKKDKKQISIISLLFCVQFSLFFFVFFRVLCG